MVQATKKAVIPTGPRQLRKVARSRSDGRFLIASLMDERGAVKVEDVANAFAMSKAQLAETAGLAREVFQKASRRSGPKAQSRVREMLEIISLVQAWAGGISGFTIVFALGQIAGPSMVGWIADGSGDLTSGIEDRGGQTDF